jgi:hypothetical protein
MKILYTLADWAMALADYIFTPSSLRRQLDEANVGIHISPLDSAPVVPKDWSRSGVWVKRAPSPATDSPLNQKTA